MAGFLTNSGLAKLAVATPITPMTVKYMAFDGGQGTPTPNMTKLFNEVYRAEIPNPVKDPDNPKNLVFSGFVPTNVGGWTVYGVGLFDSLNVLVAYLQLADPVVKSDPSSALKMSWQQDFIITLANAGETNLIVTDSIEFRHDAITHRDLPDSHPISAITGLQKNLSDKDTALANHISEAGKADEKNVKTTGNQTIGGIKSFSDKVESKDVNVTGTFTATDMPDFTGMVASFAMNSAPSGWIKCYGQPVSRTVYARLFAKIGIDFGAGDGSSTFNVPDMRNEFVRGSDDTRKVGDKQGDSLKSHGHKAILSDFSYGRDGISGDKKARWSSGDVTSTATPTNPDDVVQATGGTETRPRNIALLYCIKY